MTDNTTAVARIRKMGTSYLDTCNSVTKQIWEFCIARNLWISAAYVPGVEDTAADEESRKKNLDAEWKLNPDILAQALDITDIKPGEDVFAARINTEFPEYASFRLDPTSKAVDSFPSLGLISRSMPFPLSVSYLCLLYTSPSPRDMTISRMPSSA